MTRDGDWSAGNPPQEFHHKGFYQCGMPDLPDLDGNTPRLESLLQSLVTRLEENDQRYSTALNDLYSRLDTLSVRAGSARTDEAHHTAEALNRVESQANALAQQVREADQTRRAQQADASLRALEGRIGEYASSLPRAAPPIPPVNGQAGEHLQFGEQFTTVTAGFEQSLASGQPTAGFDELNQKIGDLAQRFDAALGNKTDAAALRAIESQLNNLTAQFAQAQQQYARVESIEGNIAHLLNATHSTDTSIDEAAQKAVQKAAQAFSAVPESVGERLDAVQRELHALSERSREIDGRTVGTLETMNATLQSLTSQIILKPHNAGTTPVLDSEPVMPSSRSAAPDLRDRQAEALTGKAAASASKQPRNMAGAAIPDFQEPPASGKTPAADAAMRPVPLIVDDDDFIASARRAANEAASQSRPLPEKMSFISRFKRKNHSPQPPFATIGKGPRPVLVMAVLLLLGSSAALVYGKFKEDSTNPVPGMPGQVAPVSPKQDPASSAYPPQQRKDISKLPVPVLPDSQRRAPLFSDPPAEGQRGQAAHRFAPAPGPVAPAMTPKTARRTNAHLTGLSSPALTSLPELPVEPGYPGLAVTITQPAQKTNTPVFSAATPLAQHAALPPATAAPTTNTLVLRSPMPPARLGPQSLRLAAARGNPQAQFEIAARYAKGNGVTRNYKKAAEWYGRAAGQGLAPAQYHLAALHERGRGVKKDTALARVWYERAANQGNVKAMHNLAVMFTGTDGRTTDYKMAAKWFSEASRHGLADSQFNLGILHGSGLGVAKNPLEAYQWLSLAASRGDSEAAKHKEKVKLQLRPETIRSAERAVQLWRARPVDKEANEVRAPKGGWASVASHTRKADTADKKLVADVQKLLNILGYNAGVADGLMGLQTAKAIKRFESRSGYKTTGRPSPELVERLKALIS